MVKGATQEERAAARAVESRRKRAVFFRNKIATAATERERFGFALDYAQAVKDGLDDAGRRAFARAITALTDEWSARS